jgi:hypothetical protein
MDNTLFHLILALGLTSITVFLLGTFVYFNKKDSSVGKVFFFYCFFISWWSFNEVLLSTSEHHKDALFYGRMMMAGDTVHSYPVCSFCNKIAQLQTLSVGAAHSLFDKYCAFRIIF